MTHVQALIEAEIKNRHFGSELVIVDGNKYVVSGHAIKHALDRRLFPTRVDNPTIARELIKVYLQNINNVLDSFSHQQYKYLGFKRKDRFRHYVLVVDQGYEDIKAFIASVWLEEIYWSITEKMLIEEQLDQHIRDLELLPA